MNILIILEDFVKDQYMVKPIIKAMMKSVGKPNAKVNICINPRLRGIGQALDWEKLQEIIDENKQVDLFLLCVDRDRDDNRRAKLDVREQKAAEILNSRKLFLAENVWQELEVWVLAGHDLPKEWNWKEIRAELNPKENYFQPFAQQKQVIAAPGQGRKPLAEAAARRYDRIRQLCPEDVAALEQRIQSWITGLI